jgi:hypothetical protein
VACGVLGSARLGSARLARLVGLICFALAAAGGCSSDAPDTLPAEPAPRTNSDPLLTAWGAEKLIPLRFVNLLTCVPGPGCPDNASYNALLSSVTYANRVFKQAGIQFWIRAVDRFYAPTFANWKATDPQEIAWWDGVSGGTGTAYDELGPIFPNMPADAWTPNGATKTRGGWITSAAAVYAANNEILVWVGVPNPAGHASSFPENGRHIALYGPSLGNELYKFAHELGHYLGLNHTWEGAAGKDPETQNPKQKADLWDFHYKPGGSGGPHAYFNSYASALPYEADLRVIEKKPCAVHCAGLPSCADCTASLCGIQPGCDNTCCQCCVHPAHPSGTGCNSCVAGSPVSFVTCHIGESSAYSESYSNGASPLKGLARVLNGINAVNVMSYHGGFQNYPYFLADSHVLLLRKYLRWDVPFTDPSGINEYRNTAYTWIAAGRRPMLGSYSFRNPLQKLDFNGDGRRDIGVWIPPTSAGTPGQLKVLLSPDFSQTSGAMIDTSFGRLGDLPVPADYDTDGRTDFAVYQPGGGVDRLNPGAAAEIHVKNSMVGSCGGTNIMHTCATCGIGTRAFAVADMTGDGKEEMVLIHTDTMTIEWRTSESGYGTTGGTWAVGDSLAQFL